MNFFLIVEIRDAAARDREERRQYKKPGITHRNEDAHLPPMCNNEPRE